MYKTRKKRYFYDPIMRYIIELQKNINLYFFFVLTILYDLIIIVARLSVYLE